MKLEVKNFLFRIFFLELYRYELRFEMKKRERRREIYNYEIDTTKKYKWHIIL